MNIASGDSGLCGVEDRWSPRDFAFKLSHVGVTPSLGAESLRRLTHLGNDDRCLGEYHQYYTYTTAGSHYCWRLDEVRVLAFILDAMTEPSPTASF